MAIYVKQQRMTDLTLKSECCNEPMVLVTNGSIQLSLVCQKCRLIRFRINIIDLIPEGK